MVRTRFERKCTVRYSYEIKETFFLGFMDIGEVVKFSLEMTTPFGV
jgi:hypothetical protein